MHLMIDLETWGKTELAAIRAAALVVFDENGEKHLTRLIDARPSLDDQLEHGRLVDADTVLWWQKQKPLSRILDNDKDMSPEAVSTVYSALDLIDVIDTTYRLAEEATAKSDRVWIWSRGRFDLQIISDLYTINGDDTTPPWRYWHERDVRTLDSFIDQVKPDQPHNPIDDCYAQIMQVSQMFRTTHVVSDVANFVDVQSA